MTLSDFESHFSYFKDFKEAYHTVRKLTECLHTKGNHRKSSVGIILTVSWRTVRGHVHSRTLKSGNIWEMVQDEDNATTDH